MSEKNKLSALLIIDMQKDFVLPNSPACIAGAYSTIGNIGLVLELARKKNWLIFHIVREHREDGSDVEAFRKESFLNNFKYTVAGSSGCEIIDQLTPLPGEYRIVKKRFSAFMNTELDLILRGRRIDQLVICGTQYPTCIRATIYDALAIGYDLILVQDAVSAKTPEIAASNIRDIRDLGVNCITTEEFIAQFK